jgi:DNA-directed RNA polymerase specialized sigma24 family protein
VGRNETSKQWLADWIEERLPVLRAVAYRMLRSFTEADDAIQDTWMRVSRADASEVENLGGSLTTILADVCLNILRTRNAQHEEALSDGRCQ